MIFLQFLICILFSFCTALPLKLIQSSDLFGISALKKEISEKVADLAEKKSVLDYAKNVEKSYAAENAVSQKHDTALETLEARTTEYNQAKINLFSALPQQYRGNMDGLKLVQQIIKNDPSLANLQETQDFLKSSQSLNEAILGLQAAKNDHQASLANPDAFLTTKKEAAEASVALAMKKVTDAQNELVKARGRLRLAFFNRGVSIAALGITAVGFTSVGIYDREHHAPLKSSKSL